jgi:hypothetical protein
MSANIERRHLPGKEGILFCGVVPTTEDKYGACASGVYTALRTHALDILQKNHVSSGHE